MVKFYEFYIINTSGIPLFHQKANPSIESVNKNMVSGFISAIQSVVSAQNDEEKIESIKFKNTKLIILQQSLYNIFFIARVSQKEKEKPARKELKKLSTFFIEDYRKHLIEWDGEINVFQSFRYRLSSYWI